MGSLGSWGNFGGRTENHEDAEKFKVAVFMVDW